MARFKIHVETALDSKTAPDYRQGQKKKKILLFFNQAKTKCPLLSDENSMREPGAAYYMID